MLPFRRKKKTEEYTMKSACTGRILALLTAVILAGCTQSWLTGEPLPGLLLQVASAVGFL